MQSIWKIGPAKGSPAMANNHNSQGRALFSRMASHSKALTSASTQFLIGNETSSHFRVSHRKQRLGLLSNREEFSLFSCHESWIPISAATQAHFFPRFPVAEIHHRRLKTAESSVEGDSLILCSPCNRQKYKHLDNRSQFPESGIAHALFTSVNLDLDRTIPSGGGS